MELQRDVALAKARIVSKERGELHNKIIRRELDVRDLLEELHVHTCLANMPINKLLLWQPNYGAKRVEKLLDKLEINQTSLVRGLTERQRRKIVAIL